MAIKKWLLPSMPEYTFDVPRAVRDAAVEDACLAVTAAKRKYALTKEPQDVKFRRLKGRQTLGIRNDHIKDRDGGVLKARIYPTTLGEIALSETLPANPRDSRITLENGRWFLCVPHEVILSQSAKTKPNLAVGVDPGVRTFLSFYSPENCGFIGQGDFARIVRLCKYLDDLLSRADKKRKDKLSSAKRKRMLKAANRLRWKIKDLISELHWKSARFLVENYSVIFLPHFEVSGMVTKTKRKLRKRSVRSMLTFSHYQFSKRLEWLAKKEGVEVVRMCEAYTSKTVNWTGKVIHNLGGRKYTSDGGLTMSRDLNGALGIYLKGLLDSTSYSPSEYEHLVA
jgi:putative transposase